jgi:hypothetical protein
MPTHETKFRVILSSPSGLEQERSSVEVVITELNQTWGSPNSASIELFTWEKSVAPGFGSEPQEVINKGIGVQWDVYLGLMYTHFGTPTKGFGSGTEEEFEKAYELWNQDRSSRKLMFYFKKSAVNPDDIDIEQLQKVREFKKGIVEKGCLYGTFENMGELEGFLRVNLTKELGELLRYQKKDSQPVILSDVEISEAKTEYERGLLDFVEGFQKGQDSIREIFDEHNQVLTELTELMRGETANIEAVSKNQDFNGLRRIVTKMATGMVGGAKKLSVIRKKYAESSQLFFEDITKYVSLCIAKASSEDRSSLKEVVLKSLNSMEGLRDTSIGAGSSMDSWGNIAQELNRARLILQTEMKSFTAAIERSIEQLKELLGLL